ncbi:hypothetical protein EP47_06250 [Legionella norrlandica]|uniref:Cytochrome P450 n=1 Tax=Legionella norrlandica TaxID=1498499 RepID=A0A0A2SP19_9GAMM|nr:cytochrome P450 [Legionella norrlandica]KGP62502.1 hypothetical protein EP47_06250 [Legionella norrlandica]
MLSPITHLRHFIQKPIPFIQQQWKKKGDCFSLYLGPKRTVILTDPNLIQLVLNDENYKKCRLIFDKIIPITGAQGIIQLEGSFWENVHAVTQPNFHRATLETYLPVFENNIQHIKENLLNTESNFFSITTRYALASIMRIILGVEWDDAMKIIADNFIQLNQKCGQKLRSIASFPLWLPTSKNQDLKKQRRLLLNIIKKKLNSVEQHSHCPFYASLMRQSPDFPALDQITTFLFAGFETTAASIAFTFYLLSKHQEIQQKVYNEVSQIVQTNSELKLQHLKAMKYTQAVYEESLRLYPPAWILAREVRKKTSLHGTIIKPGTIIIINVRGLHRHPDYWSLPNQFIPERFINSSLTHKYAYIPFGMGKRICSGFQLAMCEAVYFISKMILDFKFELKEYGRLRTKAMITQHPENNIELQAIKR